jgi:hypothetical protein
LPLLRTLALTSVPRQVLDVECGFLALPVDRHLVRAKRAIPILDSEQSLIRFELNSLKFGSTRAA